MDWRSASTSAAHCLTAAYPLCSCSENEIKGKLNARGYANVLSMDPDIAFELFFTRRSA